MKKGIKANLYLPKECYADLLDWLGVNDCE